MKFRTEIAIPSYPFQIDYSNRIFGLGSCFVDHMKEKFDYYQFQSQINPFGVIFNPVSIKNTLETIVEKRYFTKDDLFYHQDTWKSYQLHSVFNCTDAPKLLNQVNEKIQTTHRFLAQSDVLLITLGTAWVYRLKSTGEIVSNCHKVPQKEFAKELLPATEIISILKEIISLVNKPSKNIKILFTVSPVRHLKDGFVENQVSKSRLLDAVYQVADGQKAFYFPSYEIMMDDLRDYRFYEPDMIHPNKTAVEYIWLQLQQATMDNKTRQTMQQVEKIRKALQHKPFNPASEEHQAFIEKINRQIQALQKRFDWMRFDT